jgi:hypothetical protein
MNKRTILSLGFILGCLSWAVCPLISDRFEPFDTNTGFLIGQIIMALFTVYVGFFTGHRKVLVAVLGLYLGQNAYSYFLGGSEAKAWALLGLLTITFLCITPLVFGLLASGIKLLLQNLNKTKTT